MGCSTCSSPSQRELCGGRQILPVGALGNRHALRVHRGVPKMVALSWMLSILESELGRTMMSRLSDSLDSRIEAALESQASQRASADSEVARALGKEICAMGSQIHALNNRISKITSTPSIRVEHVTSLEERVIALDRSLSELRCEYLEGCLRARQIEELVMALHSNVRDLRTSLHSESKHALASNGLGDDGRAVHTEAGSRRLNYVVQSVASLGPRC